MTVLEVIQKSTEFLTNKGVDSPRLQTELLLAHVLKLPRMKLYLNFERTLTTGELDEVRALVKRRGQREPLQHIIGSTSFCGIEIAVNRNVLVPRPETELLAELGWQFLSIIHHQPSTALDFGTGSGCIAIALAANCAAARITALDSSEAALAVARQNAKQNKVGGRIEFLLGDGFNALAAERIGFDSVGLSKAADEPARGDARPTEAGGIGRLGFDLIVSNPPYIPMAEIETLQPEVRDFDPRAALDGGADGLDFYRRLAVEAGNFLNPGGKLMLEFGDGQAGDIRKIFEAQKWVVESVREDYTRRERILMARRQ